MTDLTIERRFWGIGEVLKLSWPAALSMLNATIIQFVDGFMVSKLGPDPLAAQTVAALYAMIPASAGMGLLTVVNTFVSQNLGAGRFKTCGQYAWAGLYLSLAMSFLIAPLALFSHNLFAIFKHGEQIQQMESLYFTYLMIGTFVYLPPRVLEQFFFGVHRPGVVLVTTVVSNVVNGVLAYGLILGNFGLPKMGVEGAGIATVASWSLHTAILLGVFFAPRFAEKFGTRSQWSFHLASCRDIVKYGWPAGIQFTNDIASWTIFLSLLVDRFGLIHTAASSIAFRYMQLSFMPAVGIGLATTALVGKYIGAGRNDLAIKRTHAALVTAMGYMGLCALCFVLFRYQLMDFFISSEAASNVDLADNIAEMMRIGQLVLICAAIFQVFDAVGIIFVGALRGAGDTFWPMIVTTIMSWSVIVGGGYLLVYFLPQLTSLGPWIAGSTYVIVLGLILARRFESQEWKKFNLLERRPEGGEGMPLSVATPTEVQIGMPTQPPKTD